MTNLHAFVKHSFTTHFPREGRSASVSTTATFLCASLLWLSDLLLFLPSAMKTTHTDGGQPINLSSRRTIKLEPNRPQFKPIRPAGTWVSPQGAIRNFYVTCIRKRKLKPKLSKETKWLSPQKTVQCHVDLVMHEKNYYCILLIEMCIGEAYG